MKSQRKKQSAKDEQAPKTEPIKPYCCWVWSDKFQGYVHLVSERYDGSHSLEQAIAHFDRLYSGRQYRIDQDDVVMFIRESGPQQLSLF
jgi:hypothetical protein